MSPLMSLPALMPDARCVFACAPVHAAAFIFFRCFCAARSYVRYACLIIPRLMPRVPAIISIQRRQHIFARFRYAAFRYFAALFSYRFSSLIDAVAAIIRWALSSASHCCCYCQLRRLMLML